MGQSWVRPYGRVETRAGFRTFKRFALEYRPRVVFVVLAAQSWCLPLHGIRLIVRACSLFVFLIYPTLPLLFISLECSCSPAPFPGSATAFP